MCIACGHDDRADLWRLAAQLSDEGLPSWTERSLALLGPILASQGLSLKAAPGDLRVVTRGGRQVRIRDVGAVWEAAELLLGRAIDPLAPSSRQPVDGSLP